MNRDAEITLHELEIFLAFSRTEHLGRAAEALGMSVPSVQRAVHALEQRLRVTLVEREGRRIRLVHAGRVLAEQAARILRARSDGVETVLTAAGRAQTILRVGHTFSLGIEVVPRIVARLLERERGARVQMRHGSATAMVSLLLSGEVDAVFTSISPVEPDIQVVPLFSESLVLCVAKGDPLARRKRLHLSEVRDRGFASMPEGSSSRTSLMQACARAGFTPRIVIEADDLFTIEGIVASGLGVSVLPERMGDHQHPRIARIPLDEQVPTRRIIVLAYRRDASQGALLSALVSAAKADVREERRSLHQT